MDAAVLSLADCYVLAAVKRLKATILTTDSELAKVKEVKTLLFQP
jgi:predicted nucleic acid-binding protein